MGIAWVLQVYIASIGPSMLCTQIRRGVLCFASIAYRLCFVGCDVRQHAAWFPSSLFLTAMSPPSFLYLCFYVPLRRIASSTRLVVNTHTRTHRGYLRKRLLASLLFLHRGIVRVAHGVVTATTAFPVTKTALFPIACFSQDLQDSLLVPLFLQLPYRSSLFPMLARPSGDCPLVARDMTVARFTRLPPRVSILSVSLSFFASGDDPLAARDHASKATRRSHQSQLWFIGGARLGNSQVTIR